MISIVNVPDEFHDACNAAVHSLAGQANVPPEFQGVINWLEGEGWEWVLDAWHDDAMVIDFNALGAHLFSDRDLQDYVDIDESQPISDAQRVDYGIKRIDDVREDGDGLIFQSVHPIQVQAQDGTTATVGCTVEIHGQSGHNLVFHGMYSGEESMYEALAQRGLHRDRLDPETAGKLILRHWQHPTRRPTKKSKSKS